MFLLAEYPGIQVQVFIYSSVLYVIYLHFQRIYIDPFMLTFETINECSLQLVCYHLVLFTNLVSDPSVIDHIGASMIVSMGLMLGTSILIIFAINIRGSFNKLRKYWMKKKFE